MELGLGSEILDLGEGPDGQIQPLMPVQRSMVEDQEAISHVFALLARLENGTIRDVENDGASPGVDGTGQQPLLPSVICDDHMTRKPGTETFGHAEKPEANRGFRDSKFAGIEFRQDIADVKNNGSSSKARQKCRKNQEIRHRMNMHDVVLLPEIVDRDLI